MILLNFSLEGQFITKWRTTSPNEQVIVPTHQNEIYNYTVDWGDGNIDSGINGNALHTYSNADTYTVTITGVFPRIYFQSLFQNGVNLGTDKILAIENWGNNSWTSMEGAFLRCSNLVNEASDLPDLSGVESMSFMFGGCTSFTSHPSLNDWKVDKVEDMSGLFFNAENFNNNISSWDVSNVINMADMFWQANIFNGDISMWDVSSVQNMDGTFAVANNFDQDIGGWDVSNVISMQGMFSNATSFNQDIGQWNVGSVKNMVLMFAAATAFDQDIGGWNVSSVENMRSMFESAKIFNQNLDSWDVSSVTDMSSMFRNASTFDGLIESWDVSSVETFSNMFRVAFLFTGSLAAWNVSSAINMESMIQNVPNFNGDITNWNVHNVTTMEAMLAGANSFNQNLGSWDVSNVSNMELMLSGTDLSVANYDALLIGWEQLNLQSGVTFDTGNSQYCTGDIARQSILNSYGWTINDSGIFACCANSLTYEVLEDLYFDTNGFNWNNNNGWLQDCDYCNWFGVTCDANQNVTGLNLQNNNLSGQLPQSICQLSFLQDIILNENAIGGQIPACIGGMQSLIRLILNTNDFTGGIPDFTNTPNLGSLVLSANELTGSIPASVGDLPLLAFGVSGNNLSGCYDLNLMNLCQPWILPGNVSSGNSFDASWFDFCMTGAGVCNCNNDIIPPTIDCPIGLIPLEINSNGTASASQSDFNITATDDCSATVSISGGNFNVNCTNVGGPDRYQTILATDAAGNTSQCQVGVSVTDPNNNCCSHPDLAGLRAFYDAAGGDMWKNTIANDLPWFEDCDPCGLMDGTPWFGIRCNANDRVGGFQLNFNDLSGIITPDIDLLPELSGVIIYDNPGLMGSIPASICNLNITTFYIFRNNHTGIIPPCMTGITSLIDLNFKDNSLVGPIPDFGSGTPNLFNLNLNNNNLTGGLPASLADIPNPSTMTFNGNMLQGCYPAVLENLCNSNNGTLQGLDNSTVSDGNNFDADWEDFCLSNAGACTVSAEDEWLAKIISVYPNPMDDLIHIQSKSDENVEARLYSIEGELLHIEQIKSNTTRVINTELTPGVYLLRMSSGNGYLTKKIIKI